MLYTSINPGVKHANVCCAVTPSLQSTLAERRAPGTAIRCATSDAAIHKAASQAENRTAPGSGRGGGVVQEESRSHRAPQGGQNAVGNQRSQQTHTSQTSQSRIGQTHHRHGHMTTHETRTHRAQGPGRAGGAEAHQEKIT